MIASVSSFLDRAALALVTALPLAAIAFVAPSI